MTGFAHLDGYPIGIIANDGILFSQSSLKGAHFIELACQRRIPLVFLQNITGFMVGREYEAGGHRQGRGEDGHGGRLRRGAEVHGHRRRQLRGRQLRDGRARLPAALPVVVAQHPDPRDGRAAGGPGAVDGRRAVRRPTPTATPSRRRSSRRYEREGSPYFATARLWDDGVIDPLDTRRVLAMGIEAALHAPIPETRFGVFRM